VELRLWQVSFLFISISRSWSNNPVLGLLYFLPSMHYSLFLVLATPRVLIPIHSPLLFSLNAQSDWLRSPFLNTKASLLNLTERFDSLYPKICPGYRLLDNFPDYVSFHPCDHSNGCTHKLQFNALDQLCHEASSDPSTLVVTTDTSVIPPRNMQAVLVAHF